MPRTEFDPDERHIVGAGDLGFAQQQPRSSSTASSPAQTRRAGIYGLCTGVLVGEPVARQGTKVAFVTGTLRVGDSADVVFVGIVAFGEVGERLAGMPKGAVVSVSGRISATAWADRGIGEPKAGLSLLVRELIALQHRPQAGGQQRPPQRRRPPYQRRPEPSHEPIGDGRPFDDRIEL